MRLMTLAKLAAAGAALFVLTACNTTSDGPAPVAMAAAPAAAPSYVTRSDFRLPEGSGCTGEINRFKAVMANDLETGHVHKDVYARVMGEITPAERACAGGQDGQAVAIVRSVKSRHGYP